MNKVYIEFFFQQTTIVLFLSLIAVSFVYQFLGIRNTESFLIGVASGLGIFVFLSIIVSSLFNISLRIKNPLRLINSFSFILLPLLYGLSFLPNYYIDYINDSLANKIFYLGGLAFFVLLINFFTSIYSHKSSIIKNLIWENDLTISKRFIDISLFKSKIYSVSDLSWIFVSLTILVITREVFNIDQSLLVIPFVLILNTRNILINRFENIVASKKAYGLNYILDRITDLLLTSAVTLSILSLFVLIKNIHQLNISIQTLWFLPIIPIIFIALLIFEKMILSSNVLGISLKRKTSDLVKIENNTLMYKTFLFLFLMIVFFAMTYFISLTSWMVLLIVGCAAVFNGSFIYSKISKSKKDKIIFNKELFLEEQAEQSSFFRQFLTVTLLVSVLLQIVKS